MRINYRNTNGLTITELIISIFILSIILAIVLPIVGNTINEQKNNLYDIQIDNIKKGAIAWGGQNVYLMPNTNSDSISITLGELKSKGFVDKNLTNPKTEDFFPDNMLITITLKNDSYIYSVDDSIVSDVTYDPEAPFIVLNGSSTEYVELNGTYIEKGAQARDKDGNKINSVDIIIKKEGTTVSNILTNNLSTYVITYTATDLTNGKSSSVSRNVIIHDTIAPVIMVNGRTANHTMIAKVGSSFTPPLATAVDNSGEAISTMIVGSVNTGKTGTYQLIYEAKDSSDNIGRMMLTVIVKDLGEEIFINYSVSTSLWTNQNVIVTISPVHVNPLDTNAYSFDGGATWQSSPSKAFSSNQLVRMQARDNEGRTSSIEEYNITNIDKALPICSISGNPTSWVTSSNLTVNANDIGSGVSGIKIPGASTYSAVTTTTFTVTSNGTYVATVKDIAGNTNTCGVSVTKIDAVSPTCTITGNPTSWVKNATLTITGSDSESGVVGIKKPGATNYIPNNDSTPFTVTSNGTYTAYVIDGVNRVGTCSVTVTKIDSTAPTMPVVTLKLNSTSGSGYTSGSWTNQNIVQMQSTTETESGLQKYQYSHDNVNWVDMTINRIISWEEQQNYYVRAIDNAGNVSTSSVVHTVRIDKTTPTVPTSVVRYGGPTGAVRANNDSSWTNQTLWWGGFNATDANSGVSYYQWSTGCTGSASGTLGSEYYYSNNSYDFCIRSVDNAGNASGWSSVTYIRADTAAPAKPTVTLRYNYVDGSIYPSGSWTNQNVVQVQSSTDNLTGIQKYIYSHDNVNFYDMPTNWNISWDGQWNFYVRAVDWVGNQSPSSDVYTLRIDKTVPACSSSGGSSSWYNYNRTITGTCSDGGSGCTGNVSRTFSSNTNTTTSPGTVYDNAGNGTSCPNQTVKIDKTAPSCGLQRGGGIPGGQWVSYIPTTIRLDCTDSGGSGCSESEFTKEYFTTTTTSTMSISDNAGNNTTCTVNVYLDNTNPSCSFTGSSAWETYKTLTISGSDAHSGMNAVSPGTGYVSGSSTTRTVYSAGTYAGYTRDNVGHVTSCSVTVSSRTEYRYQTCSTCNRCSTAGVSYYTYGSWSYSNKVCTSSATPYPTKSEAESKGLTLYYASCVKQSGTGNGCSIGQYYCSKYTRSSTPVYNRSCTSCGCETWGSWGTWTTTYNSETSSLRRESRTTYSAG